MDFGIMAGGRVIFASNSRTAVVRLAGTAVLAGTPVRFVFGQWMPL